MSLNSCSDPQARSSSRRRCEEQKGDIRRRDENMLKILSVGNKTIQLPEEGRKELRKKGVHRTEREVL